MRSEADWFHKKNEPVFLFPDMASDRSEISEKDFGGYVTLQLRDIFATLTAAGSAVLADDTLVSPINVCPLEYLVL